MLVQDADLRVGFDLGLLRAERAVVPQDRELVARHVLAVVSAFAGQWEICEAAMAGMVACEPGEDPALAAERRVRDLAADAESATLQLTGTFPHTGDVVCAVLADELLLDDYLRIRSVEQHLAFDDEYTPAEEDARIQLLGTRADEARRRAESFAEWTREGARICRCGKDYARHRRNAGRESWEPRDTGVCRNFVDVATLPCSAVSAETLEAAVRSWATRSKVVVTDAGVTDALRLLAQMRTGDKGRRLLVSDAIEAAAAALDWSPAAT